MAESDNFFSRWSQRKAALAKGQMLAEPTAPLKPTLTQAQTTVPPAVSGPGVAHVDAPAAPAAEPAPLTLDDVRALTPDSDFKAFVARGVSPEVRNAAMKKLFANPRYNLMDGLDTYIDDYSKADPLPAGMLRQMVGAKFLNLFDDEGAPDATVDPPSASTEPPLSGPIDAHADLRLQPNHAAAGAPDTGAAGAGAEREADPAQRPVPP